MTDIHFEDVLKLAEQLPEHEQNQLIYALRLKQITHQSPSSGVKAAEPVRVQQSASSPTREELLAEVEALRRSPPHTGDSLFGKYANPDVPEMSEEEFHAQMHAIAGTL